MYNETGLNVTTLLKREFSEERFKHRIERLKRICERDKHIGFWSDIASKRYQTEWIRNDNFVIVSKRSLLICVLPKCGSTSWHKLARDIRDPASIGLKFGWQNRQKNMEISQELNPIDGVRILKEKNAFRGIAVRHPFAKLISGWNERLQSGDTYGSFMLEAYPRMQKYASDKDPNHSIAFEDLMEYIADYGNDAENLDYHFKPMQSLCRPCLYPYNYVLKLETSSLDKPWLKSILNVTDIPWEQKGSSYFSGEKRNPTKIIRSYFRKVKKTTIQKLMKLYYYDFALFGYTFDADTLTAGGFA